MEDVNDGVPEMMDSTSSAFLEQLLRHSSDAAIVVHQEYGVIYASPAVTDVLGVSPTAFIGRMAADWVHPDDVSSMLENHEAAVSSGHAGPIIIRGLHEDESWRYFEAEWWRPDEGNFSGGTILHCRDVTPRHVAEQELAWGAQHDRLTGLPNRTLFVDQLQAAINRSQQSGGIVALLYCDLDRFKNVNDTIGHSGADFLLCEIARRMELAIRAEDLLARLHGDEFVICIDEIESWDEARSLAERLRSDLAQIFRHNGREIYLTTSIGIAIADKDNLYSASDLLDNADSAMFVAKKAGRDRIAFYDEALRSQELAEWAIRDSLHGAIENSELTLHYQPIYDLSTGALIGTEALVRWQHPARGLLSPGEFIPLAEESGVIVALGQWVMKNAVAQAKEWGFGAARQAKMWINVSALQLDRKELVSDMIELLSELGVSPQAIGIEVTETALIHAQPEIDMRLRALRDLGCSVAIDDFGTGYSSLLYLRRYSADTLKIDQEFVSGLGISRDDTAIVSSLRSLAAMLELRVVAEGVETQDQLQALRAMGCDSASGYLLARPADPSVITAILDTPIELNRPVS